jgi:hypothetical protein
MEPFPWYAVPKDMQISAAPRGLNSNLLTPVIEEEQKETPLTSPPPATILPDPPDSLSGNPTSSTDSGLDVGGSDEASSPNLLYPPEPFKIPPGTSTGTSI